MFEDGNNDGPSKDPNISDSPEKERFLPLGNELKDSRAIRQKWERTCCILWGELIHIRRTCNGAQPSDTRWYSATSLSENLYSGEATL